MIRGCRTISNSMIKKKNFGGDNSENIFLIDRPGQGSDDDRTPDAKSSGKRASQRLCNSAKKPRLAEPSSSQDDFHSKEERPKKRGKDAKLNKGRGRPPASSKPSTPISTATLKSVDNIVSFKATSTTGAMNSIREECVVESLRENVKVNADKTVGKKTKPEEVGDFHKRILKLERDMKTLLADNENKDKLLKENKTILNDVKNSLYIHWAEGIKLTVILEVELTCPICQELMYDIVSVNCGHMFCKYCLTKWMRKSIFCPLCRTVVQFDSPAVALNSFLSKAALPDEMRTARLRLIKERGGRESDLMIKEIEGIEKVQYDQVCKLLFRHLDKTEETYVPELVYEPGVPKTTKTKIESLEKKITSWYQKLQILKEIVKSLKEIKGKKQKLLQENEDKFKAAEMFLKIIITEVSKAMSTMETELKCVICTELMYDIVSVNCGHMFCRYCLTEWQCENSLCPLCPTVMQNIAPAVALNSFLCKIQFALPERLKTARRRLIEERKDKESGVNPPKLSDVVDEDHVQDGNGPDESLAYLLQFVR